MPMAGFIDYVVGRALVIAKSPGIDFDIAAREIEVIANFDRDMLRRAESKVRQKLQDAPATQIIRRAHKILMMSLDLQSTGSQRD